MASGVEFRQARQAARQSETASTLVYGGMALGVVAFMGLGYAIWNVQQDRAVQQEANAAKAKSERRAAAEARAAMTPYDKCIRKAELSIKLHAIGMSNPIISSEQRQGALDAMAATFEMECEALKQERQ